MHTKIIAAVLALLLAGCAEIEVPTPKDVITHPMGKGGAIRGWTKDEVKAKWGDPDQIIPLEPDEWGNEREEWIYQARYPNVPIDYKFLSKTKHFYFLGNVMTELRSEEEPATEAKEPTESP